MSKPKDLSGRVFGRLTVLSRAGSNHEGKALWECRCECAETVIVISYSLTSGNTRSCGCLMRQMAADRQRKHGLHDIPEYGVWVGINKRCYNPKEKQFKDYGGRGICIAPEWRHDFKAFFDYVGKRPSDTHTIERIENDGNYEPGNVKWIPKVEQALNTRSTIRLVFNGKVHHVSKWAKITGLSYTTIMDRIREQNLTVRETLTLPTERMRDECGRFAER